MGWSLYLVWRGGQLYNAAPFQMGLGAYFGAYVVVNLDWPYPLALITAAALGALVSFLMGRILGRAPAFTVAIFTIGAIIVFQQVVLNLEFLGGPMGIVGIPKMDGLLGVAWFIVLIVGVFIYRLDHSHIGRAMEATFVNPAVASTLRVDIYKLRVFLFAFAGAIGSLAGVLYASRMGAIIPGYFGFPLLLLLFTFFFVGGSTTMWGVVAFAPALWAWPLFLPEAVANEKNIIYGSLLIAVLLLRPEGVIDKRVVRAVRLKSQALLERLRSS